MQTYYDSTCQIVRTFHELLYHQINFVSAVSCIFGGSVCNKVKTDDCCTRVYKESLTFFLSSLEIFNLEKVRAVFFESFHVLPHSEFVSYIVNSLQADMCEYRKGVEFMG